MKLEIPASRVFLGADAKLLRVSRAGARMPLSICIESLFELNIHSLAKTDTAIFKGPSSMNSFVFVY